MICLLFSIISKADVQLGELQLLQQSTSVWYMQHTEKYNHLTQKERNLYDQLRKKAQVTNHNTLRLDEKIAISSSTKTFGKFNTSEIIARKT